MGLGLEIGFVPIEPRQLGASQETKAHAVILLVPQETKAHATSMRLRVGTYNLLCPTYGVKWGEREYMQCLNIF